MNTCRIAFTLFVQLDTGGEIRLHAGKLSAMFALYLPSSHIRPAVESVDTIVGEFGGAHIAPAPDKRIAEPLVDLGGHLVVEQVPLIKKNPIGGGRPDGGRVFRHPPDNSRTGTTVETHVGIAYPSGIDGIYTLTRVLQKLIVKQHWLEPTAGELLNGGLRGEEIYNTLPVESVESAVGYLNRLAHCRTRLGTFLDNLVRFDLTIFGNGAHQLQLILATLQGKGTTVY